MKHCWLASARGTRKRWPFFFAAMHVSFVGVAYRVLRDASEADDLLQDIFLLIHRLCKTFDSSKGSARFWILQMTYRRAISRRRYLTSRHFYTRLDLDEATEAYGNAFEASPGKSRGRSTRSLRQGRTCRRIQGTLREPARNPASVFLRGLHVRRDCRQTSAKPPEMSATTTIVDWKSSPADADFRWQIAGKGAL